MAIKFVIERREDKKAYGTLSWNEKNLRSGAISGPYGNRELPAGLYHVKRNGLIDKSTGDSAFCDSLFRCWFQLLTPQFSTHRTELGIHPDGGDYIGTRGCIGIIDADTVPWYNALISVPRNSYTILEVIDLT